MLQKSVQNSLGLRGALNSMVRKPSGCFDFHTYLIKRNIRATNTVNCVLHKLLRKSPILIIPNLYYTNKEMHQQTVHRRTLRMLIQLIHTEIKRTSERLLQGGF